MRVKRHVLMEHYKPLTSGQLFQCNVAVVALDNGEEKLKIEARHH
uniref:Uncharacterized protein n=1 Tax=Rhodnius prolixus TaxID=13249 RepID=A0A905R0H6_RHOPR